MALDFEQVKKKIIEYIKQRYGFEPNFDNRLFELGIDSIGSVELFEFIQNTFDVKLDFQENHQTLNEIIDKIVSKSK